MSGFIPSTKIPAGTRRSFAMDSPPPGWLVEDGGEYSRTVYAELFAAIGTTWGAGDGATTFNVPDMQDHFERGASGVRPVGTVEADEIRAHNHRAQANTNRANRSNPAIGYPAGGTGAQNEQMVRSGTNTRFPSDYIENEGGAETRPQAAAVLKCIKY